MKKRFLALLLVLTLLVGLMPAALAADTVDVSALPEYTAGAGLRRCGQGGWRKRNV